MTLRVSNAALNFMLSEGSFKDCFENGCIQIYSGAQPTSANAAVQGTLLCTITNSSGSWTPEVLSYGSFTLTGGSSGSVNSVTVNGVNILGPSAITYATSLINTATLCVAAINNAESNVMYYASNVGGTSATVTLTAKPGTGTYPNGFAVVCNTTTLTSSVVAFANGVAAVNGLLYGSAAAGVINMLASQTWSGVNAATGTAGWFRALGSVTDPGTLDSAAVYRRFDGAISTSAAEMIMTSTALTSGATTTIPTWSMAMPTL